MEITSTKISGLAVDTEYNFSLVLKTSAGTYSSEKLTVRTHKMTELHGITVTPGVLDREAREELEAGLERIGGRLIEQVRIDTTHFVCTEGRGPAWEKAVDMNIPVVQPEWLQACETEGRLVGVRGYYLGADTSAARTKSIAGSTPQRDQQQRSGADRRASQPVPVNRQPPPITKITPPTPEAPSASFTNGKGSDDRDPPSPFTKVDEAEENAAVEVTTQTTLADRSTEQESNGDQADEDVQKPPQDATQKPQAESIATVESTTDASTIESKAETDAKDSPMDEDTGAGEGGESFDEVKI